MLLAYSRRRNANLERTPAPGRQCPSTNLQTLTATPLIAGQLEPMLPDRARHDLSGICPWRRLLIVHAQRQPLPTGRLSVVSPGGTGGSGLPQHERHDGVVENTFRGALVRSPSRTPWSRMVVGPDTVCLEPRLTDAVEFRRGDVRHIVMERHRGPFVFRTLFWIVTKKRHTHAFVAFRTKRLLEALQADGWPVRE